MRSIRTADYGVGMVRGGQSRDDKWCVGEGVGREMLYALILWFVFSILLYCFLVCLLAFYDGDLSESY